MARSNSIATMWWMMGTMRIGEASHPGLAVFSKFVAKFESDDLFYIESSNVTNLQTHIAMLSERRTGIHYIQEHSAPASKHGWIKKVFKDSGKQIILSDLDSYAKHNLAGVATITGRRKALGVVVPRTDAFKEANADEADGRDKFVEPVAGPADALREACIEFQNEA